MLNGFEVVQKVPDYTQIICKRLNICLIAAYSGWSPPFLGPKMAKGGKRSVGTKTVSCFLALCCEDVAAKDVAEKMWPDTT